MKNRLLILLSVILLAACERPATRTSWSPINDVSTSVPASLNTAAAWQSQTLKPGTQPAAIEATPRPTLDLKMFPNPLPESLKGYELISWQAGEIWNFTLVTSTNREKNFEELMNPESQVTEDGFVKITVSGFDQIKKVMDMLPADSEVFWGGMDLSGQVPEGTVYFSYPPLEIMNEVADFCARNEINLLNLAELD